MQVPEQLVAPYGHCVRQLPLLQTWLEVQAVPQAPQLAGSLVTSTQAPLQFR